MDEQLLKLNVKFEPELVSKAPVMQVATPPHYPVQQFNFSQPQGQVTSSPMTGQNLPQQNPQVNQMQAMPTNSYPGYSTPGTGYAVQAGWNGPPGMTQQQWPTQGPYPQTYFWDHTQVQTTNAEVHQGINNEGTEEVNAYYNNPYLQQYQKQQGVPPPPMYPNVRSNQQLWQPPPQQWGGNQRFAQQ